MLSEKEHIAISKHLAYLLRHHPEAAKLDMDKYGWVRVDDVLTAINNTFTFNACVHDIYHVVDHDDKRRYALSDDSKFIRANQGHSIKVDVGLEEKIPPNILWHGTATRFRNAIEESGLTPQTRLYVHLSSDYDTAVIVGSRHGSPYIYQIDAARMASDGIKFFISANGIWLTDYVAPKYLIKEEEWKENDTK